MDPVIETVGSANQIRVDVDVAGLLTTAFGELSFFFVDLPFSKKMVLLFWLISYS